MRYEITPEEHARVLRTEPKWQRDPSLRNASLFNREIDGGADNARYNIAEQYLVVRFYTDHRQARPVPSYGLYEDTKIRLAFQYIAITPREIALGRTDLDVRSRGPSFGDKLFSAHFAEVPLPTTGISGDKHAEIRERIRFVLSQWAWPYGSEPILVRDAKPGEIDLSIDAHNKGVVLDVHVSGN